MDAFCCILLVTRDPFSLIWSKSVVFTSPRRSTPTLGLALLAWKTRKNNSWGCSLQEYGQREQPSLPQTRFLLSIPNLPSEKRFAHRRKRGYIKVNALKVQQLNSLKLPNKQTSKKNLSSHSSPNPPSHVIQLTISDDLRRSSSTDPRRTTGGFSYSSQVSLTIQNSNGGGCVNLSGHFLVAFSLVWFNQGGNILLLKVRQAFSTLRIR